jgi:hypothetical protein
MIRRLAAFAGAAVATLAFAAGAQAAPTTPVMNPMAYYQCGTPVASWTPSTPDPGGVILGYRVDIGDLSTGTAGVPKGTNALSMSLPGLSTNHQYVVRVRAIQFRFGAITYSASSGRTFKKACLFYPVDRITREYVAYNPFPECIMCGVLDDLKIEDPAILRALPTAKLPAAEAIRGVEIEADGSVVVM